MVPAPPVQGTHFSGCSTGLSLELPDPGEDARSQRGRPLREEMTGGSGLAPVTPRGLRHLPCVHDADEKARQEGVAADEAGSHSSSLLRGYLYARARTL